MTNHFNSLLSVYAAIAAVAISLIMTWPHEVLSLTSTPINGYLWSDNIGWVDLNCNNTNSCSTNNFGFSIDSSGTLSGYAWSENVGWISANTSDLTGCPAAPCTAAVSGSALSGWLKALAADGKGWDGWISLSGTGYGVTTTGGSFSGYAWGDTNIGWLDFSKATTLYGTCTPSYSCSADGTTILYTDTTCQQTSYAVCAAPTYCVPQQNTCQEPPVKFVSNNGYSGHLQVSPQIVRKSKQVNVHWSVANVSGCTVRGDNGDGPWNDYNASSYTSTGSHQSSAIVQQTSYTLTCTPLDGSTFQPEKATVNMIPVFNEN